MSTASHDLHSLRLGNETRSTLILLSSAAEDDLASGKKKRGRMQYFEDELYPPVESNGKRYPIIGDDCLCLVPLEGATLKELKYYWQKTGICLKSVLKVGGRRSSVQSHLPNYGDWHRHK